jgi:hypothetical protein
MRPFQALENTAIDVLTQRALGSASGAQLDVLGRIVGQGRGGLSDSDYVRYIRARVAANRSGGKREDLIAIAVLILADASQVVVRDYPTAGVLVRIDGLAESAAVETALIAFLGGAVAAGVRLIVQTNSTAASGAFTFSGGSTGLGFDNTVSPGTGGHIANGQSN